MGFSWQGFRSVWKWDRNNETHRQRLHGQGEGHQLGWVGCYFVGSQKEDKQLFWWGLFNSRHLSWRIWMVALSCHGWFISVAVLPPPDVFQGPIFWQSCHQKISRAARFFFEILTSGGGVESIARRFSINWIHFSLIFCRLGRHVRRLAQWGDTFADWSDAFADWGDMSADFRMHFPNMFLFSDT